jgi:hypothetical protein
MRWPCRRRRRGLVCCSTLPAVPSWVPAGVLAPPACQTAWGRRGKCVACWSERVHKSGEAGRQQATGALRRRDTGARLEPGLCEHGWLHPRRTCCTAGATSQRSPSPSAARRTAIARGQLVTSKWRRCTVGGAGGAQAAGLSHSSQVSAPTAAGVGTAVPHLEPSHVAMLVGQGHQEREEQVQRHADGAEADLHRDRGR